MPDPEAEPAFCLDAGGVGMIMALALVVAPVTVLSSLWILTSGFDLGSVSILEWVVSVGALLIGGLVIRAGVRELRGGMGLEIDSERVSLAGVTLRWDEIESLHAPNFGLLELCGPEGEQILLRTYLFTPRAELISFIAERTGKTVPELGVGS